ncbi:MAG TPA: helix-turn-helix transcriptional regulator [Bacilli bacterium]
MIFYSELKDLRKVKGFTIREVAERSGVSSAYISQLENGNRGVPSPDILLKLSDGLSSSYSDLMKMAGYLDELNPAVSEQAVKNPINLRRFLRDNELIYDGIVLTEEDKERVERLLAALFWKESEKRNQS